MPLFNYQEKMIGIPDSWKQTNGAGVKIAFLDTGATLTAAGMQHLDMSGRKFDVTLPGFDPQTAAGDDSVPDTSFGTAKHGTQLLSMLAASSPDDDSGVRGMTPDAEIYIIKIQDSAGEIFAENFLKALRLAVRLDVDIVSNSSFPRINDMAIADQIEGELNNLKAKNTLFVTALKNRSTHTSLNRLKSMPLKFEYGILPGVALNAMVAGLPDDFQFNPRISYLIPEVEVVQYTHADNSTGAATNMTSSHSSALLSGLLALCLSSKRSEDVGFTRFSKSEAISAVSAIGPVFSKQNIGTKTFQFFHNS